VTPKDRTILIANRILDELRAIGREHDGQPGFDGHEFALGLVAALRNICDTFELDIDEMLSEVSWVKSTKVEPARGSA
jgi:hypothetical protein